MSYFRKKNGSTMELDGWMYTVYEVEEGETLHGLMQEVADAYENAGMEVDGVRSCFTPKHDALTCRYHELFSNEGTHKVEVQWRMPR